MRWVLRLVELGPDSGPRSVDLIEIDRPAGLADIANLGLTLAEAKQLLARAQQAVVAAQAHDHAVRRPDCAACDGRCHVKDWRRHQIATLLGGVTVRLPRWLCPGCGRTETGISWPSHCRSTPELGQLQAQLSALMTYRVAAGVLAHLLPVAAGTSPETWRSHTLKVGEQLRDTAVAKPATAASTISISLDSTFIRCRHDAERHLEVRVGNVETPDGGRQVFGAVAKSDTDIAMLIRRNLETLGWTGATDLTAFTDGCSGLRSILADAGVTKPPILDWFHIAMRLQHAKQAATGLATDAPGRAEAKALIVEQVERLHWRIWNGKAPTARPTIERIGTVMHVFKGESGHRTNSAPSRKLWRAARNRQLPYRPEYLAHELRQTLSCGLAGRDVDYRSDREFPGQSAHEQVPADALVATRGGSAPAGSLRGLQRRARLRLRPRVRSELPPIPVISGGGLIH